MKKEFVGIDVSKLTLDVWVHQGRSHRIFSNDTSGFAKMFQWIKVISKEPVEMIFCFEHTGMYSLNLAVYLQENNHCFYMVSGLAVKRSMGLKRGKNDKTDARELAKYAYQKQEELKPTCLPSKRLMKLKDLLSLRLKIVRDLTGYKTRFTEQKNVLALPEDDITYQITLSVITTLKENIKILDKQIQQLIEEDSQLNEVYKNILTLKGVGPVLAATMIAVTHNFTAFENWRKLACYAGTAPFEHSSGSSYKGKTKVSTLGNRYLKSLLTQAAASAIQHSPEMKIYYQRRVAEGKSKMSVLNIIRNKILSRIFAIVKRQSPYVDTYKFAA